MQHAGIGPKQLANPDEWLDHRAVVEALEIGAAESRDPGFGLSFAESASWTDLGTFGAVMFNSPTIGAAIGNGCRYLALQQNAALPKVELCDGDARFIYPLVNADAVSHAQHSELVLGVIVRLCREGTINPGWAPREIHFKHARPDSIKAREFFRCPILYDQPVDAAIMAPEDLEIPMQSASAELLTGALHEAELLISRLPVAFELTDQVARIVMSSLSTGNATIDHVAHLIGSSPRTIQRRLRDRGTSFNDVVANTRLELSRRYLCDTSLTLTDVALLLGYSDLSAFSRAFRRWTGHTAIEFRRGQLRARRP